MAESLALSIEEFGDLSPVEAPVRSSPPASSVSLAALTPEEQRGRDYFSQALQRREREGFSPEMSKPAVFGSPVLSGAALHEQNLKDLERDLALAPAAQKGVLRQEMAAERAKLAATQRGATPGDGQSMTLEEFAGLAPASPAAKPPAAPVHKLDWTPSMANFNRSMEIVKQAGGEIGGVLDFLLGMPAFVANLTAELTGTNVAALHGVPLTARKGEYTAYTAGREVGQVVSKPIAELAMAVNPMRLMLSTFGSEKAIEESFTTKGMEKLMEKIEALGVQAENVSNGWISRDAVPIAFDALLAGLPMAAKKGIDTVAASRRLKQKAMEMQDAANAEATARTVTPEEFAARVPVQQHINEMLGIKTPAERAKAQRERRKQATEAFAREPAKEPLPPEEAAARGEGTPYADRTYVDTAESQFVAEERMLMRERQAASSGESLVNQNEPTGTSYETGSSPRAERVGQADVLRILQKPGFQRTAEDLVTLRKARQEGKATPDAMVLLAAAGLGAAAGAVIDDDALRGALLGGATGAAAARPFVGTVGRVPYMRGESGMVLGKPGSPHPKLIETLSDAIQPKREMYAVRAGVEADRMQKPVSDWADRAISRWLQKPNLGQGVAEIEIPAFNGGTQKLGDVVAEALISSPASHYKGWKEGFAAGLDKVSDTEAIFNFKTPSAARQSLTSYLSHAGDYLRQNVPPEKLAQYDIPRALRETAANDARVAKEMEKAAAASTKDLPVYKDYGDGMKWVELKLPEKLTEEQAKGVKKATAAELEVSPKEQARWDADTKHPVYIAIDAKGKPVRNSYTQNFVTGATPEEAYLASRLAEEGNQMGHCVGGYCEGVASGKSRIYSLRDAKGRSHVTVEVGKANTGLEAHGMEIERGVANFFGRKPSPDSILQIKGKQNRAPVAEYLPYVQDFVKSGKWGEVGDLQNTGLVDLNRAQGSGNIVAAQQRLIDKGHRYVTDAELNTELAPASPKGQRGAADPKLLIGLSAVGLGGLIGAGWADDPTRGAVLGLIAGGVLGVAGTKARFNDILAGLDKAGGMVSTRIMNASGLATEPLARSTPLHKALNDFERHKLEGLATVADKFVPWMKAVVDLPKSATVALDSALIRADSAAVAAINKGNPELVNAWREVRNTLTDLGKQSQSLGRFKELLDEYFPRRVKDFPGLMAKLDTPVKTHLEKLLFDANEKAMKDRKMSLSEPERDAIINKELRNFALPQTYQPGYARARANLDLTPELQKFYHTPQEALMITAAEVTHDMQLAKFFGKNLVQGQQGGRTYINVGSSIGALVGAEIHAGRIKLADSDLVSGLIKSRFGAGERSPAKLWQDMRNIGYGMTIANPLSGIMQAGDIIMSVYAHDLRPTLVAVGNILTGNNKLTTKSLGMSDHIAEDLARTSIPGSRHGRLATAGGAVAGAAAGAILADDPWGALPGAFGGAFTGRMMVNGTAETLHRMMKQGTFAPMDVLGKNTHLGATLAEFEPLSRTAKGVEKIRERYGTAYGDKFPQLLRDLRAGENTDLVRGLAFMELARMQNITKLETTQLMLDNPNFRPAMMLKGWAMKQADVIRRDAYNLIKAGAKKGLTEEGYKLAGRGLYKLTAIATVLGISGAAPQVVKDFVLDRPIDLKATDILENTLKTFGLSNYIMDSVRDGKIGVVKTIGSILMPPWMIMENIIQAKPEAVRSVPVAGALYENYELGGRERAEINKAKQAKKAGREFELSDRAVEHLEKKREQRQIKRDRLQE